MHKKLEMSVRYPNKDIQQAVRSQVCGQKSGLNQDIKEEGVSPEQIFKTLGISVTTQVDNVGQPMEEQVQALTNSIIQGSDRGELESNAG